MRVLVLNSGSSSLKARVLEIPAPAAWGQGKTVMAGSLDGIGGRASLRLTVNGSTQVEHRRAVVDHEQAGRWLFEHLEKDTVEAVGHRVVHGGDRFRQPVRVDAGVLTEIENLNELAPLHNPACLAGIRGARGWLGERVPMVAVFDTAFHATLPPHAAQYAIPQDLARKHGIRRYGFHGIAHASLAAIGAASLGRPHDQVRLITLQLGNGCSATAIDRGRSVDTSMGFTPLEGLVMGTRSGDVDPSLVPYLARREGVSADEVERWLNERSGLLGVSGLSHDMRTILAAAEEDPGSPAALALDLFCYRARKYLGAYLAVLGGAEAVVFGGCIGEGAPAVRARICEGMAWCGLRLDSERNRAAAGLTPGQALRISTEDSTLSASVAAVDEETEIARQTVRCLRDGSA